MIGGMGPKKTLRLAARHAQAVNWFPVGKEGIEALKLTLAGHCEAEGTDVDAIRLTMMTFPPDADGEDEWLADMEMYRGLGFDEVYLAPSHAHPAEQIEHWASTLVPRVAAL